ncbi:hypothetical protein [Halobacterium noricense]|uniref:hypothetical protein n=1 Tax=Halobacterium noricense TaxID=223182 RepID=UPI001E603999|nr:hypothetical protein [Halobacterium noricense]UHH24424.1 hypothetical protein LT974_10530 [Halobacterium noricense]
MRRLDADRLRHHLAGDRRPRRLVVLCAVSLVSVASVAFLLGLDAGLYEFSGWLVIVPGIAVAGGILGAGLVPTVGSLWLVGVWWYVFPPLVGYVTGEWMGAGRYTHPRMLGFAYGSARAELLGGVETSVNFGLLLAVLVGVLGYVAGSAVSRLAMRVRSSR